MVLPSELGVYMTDSASSRALDEFYGASVLSLVLGMHRMTRSHRLLKRTWREVDWWKWLARGGGGSPSPSGSATAGPRSLNGGLPPKPFLLEIQALPSFPTSCLPSLGADPVAAVRDHLAGHAVDGGTEFDPPGHRSTETLCEGPTRPSALVSDPNERTVHPRPTVPVSTRETKERCPVSRGVRRTDPHHLWEQPGVLGDLMAVGALPVWTGRRSARIGRPSRRPKGPEVDQRPTCFWCKDWTWTKGPLVPLSTSLSF